MFLIYDDVWALNLNHVKDFRIFGDSIRFFYDDAGKEFIEWEFEDEKEALTKFHLIFRSVDYLIL